jgi:hypothetical protein
MPPVIVALAAAAGFFAAARMISAMIGEPPPEQMQAGDQPKHATAADTARDLGQLEFDSHSGVYRPKPSA